MIVLHHLPLICACELSVFSAITGRYEWAHLFWAELGGSIEGNVCRWNRSIEQTREHIHKPNHTMVRYEDMVADCLGVMEKVGSFLGLSYTAEMLDSYAHTAGKVVKQSEVWHNEVGKEIKNANGKKFYEIFTVTEQKQILDSLVSLEGL